MKITFDTADMILHALMLAHLELVNENRLNSKTLSRSENYAKEKFSSFCDAYDITEIMAPPSNKEDCK